MKYRIKVLVEELTDSNSRTGREMVLRMDHIPRERNRMGLMISHWLHQAEMYFNTPEEHKFPGETLELQKIIGELKLFMKKIESGTYKIAELIALSSMIEESSSGNGCLIINFQRENPYGESD